MMAKDKLEYSGALVGWKLRRYGDRLMLQLQSVTKPPPHSAEDVQIHFMLLDSTQAVQLGHTLFQEAGQSAPQEAPRNWLGRFFSS